MKFVLFLILFLQLNAFAQQEERFRIEFLADQDSFPDCRTLFYANGNYIVPNLALPEIDIPNTIPVIPTKLSLDSSIIFHSFSSEAKKLGSLDFDEFQIIPYTREEVRELILASKDSGDVYWRIQDEEYLSRTFGIVYDAKSAPVPKRTKGMTAQVESPIESMIVTSGIIDGVYIDNRSFVRIEPLDLGRISMDFYYRSFRLRNGRIQPKLDSLLRPFYFSNYEVTNVEYREFIKWVNDSIELHMAYDNLPAMDAMLLLNCSNKERKALDSMKRKENLTRFGLSRKNQKKISEGNWAKSTMDLYYPQPARFYKRREKDSRKIIYKQSPTKFVSIYPDTSGFDQFIDGVRILNMQLGNMSWHPAYEDYPVVNVNNDQIMAYCHWKQNQLNQEFKDDGFKITVRPPTITEYEFATKRSLGSTGYQLALDQSNDNFITHKRITQENEFPFYQSVRYNPFRKEERASLHYRTWFRANYSESPVKFLNGNVSEFVLDEVTTERWNDYRINEPFPKTKANFILGSNYKTDIKTISDDQYNAIFYKSALENGKSSPLISFRLVYLVEKL